MNFFSEATLLEQSENYMCFGQGGCVSCVFQFSCVEAVFFEKKTQKLFHITKSSNEMALSALPNSLGDDHQFQGHHCLLSRLVMLLLGVNTGKHGFLCVVSLLCFEKIHFSYFF